MTKTITDAEAAEIFTSLIEAEEVHLPDPPHPAPKVDPDEWAVQRSDSPASSSDLFYEG